MKPLRKGAITYIGCIIIATLTKKNLERALHAAGLDGTNQQLHFLNITKSGTDDRDKIVHYLF